MRDLFVTLPALLRYHYTFRSSSRHCLSSLSTARAISLFRSSSYAVLQCFVRKVILVTPVVCHKISATSNYPTSCSCIIVLLSVFQSSHTLTHNRDLLRSNSSPTAEASTTQHDIASPSTYPAPHPPISPDFTRALARKAAEEATTSLVAFLERLVQAVAASGIDTSRFDKDLEAFRDILAELPPTPIIGDTLTPLLEICSPSTRAIISTILVNSSTRSASEPMSGLLGGQRAMGREQKLPSLLQVHQSPIQQPEPPHPVTNPPGSNIQTHAQPPKGRPNLLLPPLMKGAFTASSRPPNVHSSPDLSWSNVWAQNPSKTPIANVDSSASAPPTHAPLPSASSSLEDNPPVLHPSSTAPEPRVPSSSKSDKGRASTASSSMVQPRPKNWGTFLNITPPDVASASMGPVTTQWPSDRPACRTKRTAAQVGIEDGPSNAGTTSAAPKRKRARKVAPKERST